MTGRVLAAVAEEEDAEVEEEEVAEEGPVLATGGGGGGLRADLAAVAKVRRTGAARRRRGVARSILRADKGRGTFAVRKVIERRDERQRQLEQKCVVSRTLEGGEESDALCWNLRARERSRESAHHLLGCRASPSFGSLLDACW